MIASQEVRQWAAAAKVPSILIKNTLALIAVDFMAINYPSRDVSVAYQTGHKFVHFRFQSANGG